MDFKELQQEVKRIDRKGGGNPDIINFQDDTETFIRLVPMKNPPEDNFIGGAFVKAMAHYRSGRIVPETTFSPITFGEDDPVVEFVKLSTNKKLPLEKFKTLMNMNPSNVFITTAVVRGKEEAGTKLLVLTESQYKQLVIDIGKACILAELDPDDVNPEDPNKGYDILVSCVGKETTGKPYRSFNYGINLHKQKPLHADKGTINNLLENQPSWESVYPRVSPEKLEGWLKTSMEMGDDEDLDDEISDTNENTTSDHQSNESEDDIIARASADLENMISNNDSSAPVESPQEEDDDLPF